MTILYTDPIFLKHETGGHPENPNRLRSILRLLDEHDLLSRCSKGEFSAISEAAATEVHDPGMLAAEKAMCAAGGGYLDPDTVVSPESFMVALAAAGAATAAVDAVLEGKDKNALCLIRPPGHHATPDRIMGFCLLNNIALAAHHARKVHGLNRILIVDWDVHHGNGTQDIFYADPGVFFYSIHRYGHGFYPGSGAHDETGTGPGLGYTLNADVRYGTSRADYHARFRHDVEKVADKIKPELVLISAGFDAHAEDPVGSLGLETEDFSTLTRLVMDVANTHAKGRVVSCLEGGYNLDALAVSVKAHLQDLLDFERQ